MAKSQATKKAKNNMIIFEVISIALTVIPILFFIGYGFYYGTSTEKITLSISAIIGLIFAVLNLLLKWHIRSGLWIVIFGICYALKSNMDMIMSVVVTMAITTAVDEFVVMPLAKRYKEKYHINKEIDKRI